MQGRTFTLADPQLMRLNSDQSPLYKTICHSLRGSQEGGENAGHLLGAVSCLEGSRFLHCQLWTKCLAKSRKANVVCAAVERGGSEGLKTGQADGTATGSCPWALCSGWGSRWAATAAGSSLAFSRSSRQIFPALGASCGAFKSKQCSPAFKEFPVSEGDKPQVDSFNVLSRGIQGTFLC